MESAARGPRARIRLLLVAIIAFTAGACTAPPVKTAADNQAAAEPSRWAVAESTSDPVKVASDAMERQMLLILAAAHPGPTQ